MALTVEATFDDDLFDAEVLVERIGGSRFTVEDLGRLMGAPSRNGARHRVHRGRVADEVPAPDFPGGRNTADVWSKRQVVRIVAERLGRGQTVVV